MDGTEATSLAVGADALVEVELDATRMPELEADRARERRARWQKQKLAESRGSVVAPSGIALTWLLPRTGAKTAGPSSCAQRLRVPGWLIAGGWGGVAVNRALGEGWRADRGVAGDVSSDVGADPRRLRSHKVAAVRIDRRDEGDEHAGERAVGDEQRR